MIGRNLAQLTRSLRIQSINYPAHWKRTTSIHPHFCTHLYIPPLPLHIHCRSSPQCKYQGLSIANLGSIGKGFNIKFVPITFARLRSWIAIIAMFLTQLITIRESFAVPCILSVCEKCAILGTLAQAQTLLQTIEGCNLIKSVKLLQGLLFPTVEQSGPGTLQKKSNWCQLGLD